jgi:hypothetical protein
MRRCWPAHGLARRPTVPRLRGPDGVRLSGVTVRGRVRDRQYPFSLVENERRIRVNRVTRAPHHAARIQHGHLCPACQRLHRQTTVGGTQRLHIPTTLLLA